VSRSRTLVALSTAVAVAVLVLGACGGGEQEEAVPSDPVLALGQQVYKRHCATCHGSRGGGGQGVKLAGVVAQRFPNIEDQIEVIANGRANMPKFSEKLSPEEMDAVARWEREGF
jgi:mono/diheme cytochrome c family protein